MSRSRDEALDELRQIAAAIDQTEGEARRLYDRRTEVYLELRAFDPPTTQRVIAEAAGVTDNAVVQTLRKAKSEGAQGAA